uniref:Uncharacterized protein n=1 Tax=Magnetococcus massalia (strain MO-1) TaxID=451514 RepID=A0A1S7LKA4_MAGMO|nr:protein of unknown function [Candidatus Magnetococcus massalia]
MAHFNLYGDHLHEKNDLFFYITSVRLLIE